MLIASIEFIGADVTDFDGTYHANVDFVNGTGKNDGDPYQAHGSSSLLPDNIVAIDGVEHGKAPINNTIFLQGWMGVNGGIHGYVYSVNGGDLVPVVSGGADGEPLPGHYAGMGLTAEGSTKNGLFSSAETVLVADLSAYAGQTVTVTFYAVPETAQNTVALILTISNVVVPEAEVDDKAYDLTYTEAQTAGVLVGFQWIQYLVDDVQTVQAWGKDGVDGKNVFDFANNPVEADPFALPAGTTSFGYYGWFGISDNCDTDPCDIGYSLDGAEVVYAESFMTDSNTGALALLPGATSAPNVKVMVDLTGLTGAHNIQIIYKAADGTLVLMDSINVVIAAE